MKLNRGADTESKWVESIFGLCKSHGIGLCVVVPPVRLDYREALGADEDDIFSAIRDIVARNPEIEFRSYHSSNAFDATDFADADHLNRKGAEKLTAMIRRDFGIGQGAVTPPGRMGEFGNGGPG